MESRRSYCCGRGLKLQSRCLNLRGLSWCWKLHRWCRRLKVHGCRRWNEAEEQSVRDLHPEFLNSPQWLEFGQKRGCFYSRERRRRNRIEAHWRSLFPRSSKISESFGNLNDAPTSYCSHEWSPAPHTKKKFTTSYATGKFLTVSICEW